MFKFAMQFATWFKSVQVRNIVPERSSSLNNEKNFDFQLIFFLLELVTVHRSWRVWDRRQGLPFIPWRPE